MWIILCILISFKLIWMYLSILYYFECIYSARTLCWKYYKGSTFDTEVASSINIEKWNVYSYTLLLLQLIQLAFSSSACKLIYPGCRSAYYVSVQCYIKWMILWFVHGNLATYVYVMHTIETSQVKLFLIWWMNCMYNITSWAM